MRFPASLVAARFVARDNRFRATVDLAGRLVPVHVPNSGRMRELLVPGAEVRLAPSRAPARRTAFDLALVRCAAGWVSLDARLPPRLFAEWLQRGGGGPLAGWLPVQWEVSVGHSRVDLLLGRGDDRCWVETKSVTLVREGVALFPDAPTERGRRHLETLAALVESGQRAAVAFVVQRGDATRFRPNDETDPAFGAALRDAIRRGVTVVCCTCTVGEGGVEVVGEIPLG
ncbi:MAG: DNA/RNA nuclease SfsA [Anaerolineae bacterium]|jgi:sugar fermentation stimulation protein A|nr:DNA/RNA nuclease SfsA [Anaerolineae bacterium]